MNDQSLLVCEFYISDIAKEICSSVEEIEEVLNASIEMLDKF